MDCCGRWCSGACRRVGCRRRSRRDQRLPAPTTPSAADGRLDAVETITGEFPSGRHGIFRYWDVANPNSPQVRQEPDITSILLDGEPVPYQLLWEDGGPVPGGQDRRPRQHAAGRAPTSTRLRYTIPGVLDPGSTGENRQLRRRRRRPGLDVGVLLERHRAVVEQRDRARRRPRDAARATSPVPQCSVGFGDGRACDGLTVSRQHVDLTAPEAGAAHPGHPAGGCRRADPGARSACRGPIDWDRVLGSSLGGVGVGRSALSRRRRR